MRYAAISTLCWLGLINLSDASADNRPCVNIGNNLERLACFDREAAKVDESSAEEAIGVPSPDQPRTLVQSKFAAKPAWLEGFTVADEATLSKLGTNAATIAASQTRGERSSIVKAAVLWTGSALNERGWQPVVAAAINRNSLTSSATDVRTLALGLYGPLGNYPDGVGVSSSISASARKDYRKHTAGEAVTFDNYLLVRGLADGTPFLRQSNEFQVFPKYGIMLEHRRKVAAGQSTGTSLGAFAGLYATLWPGAISDRLQISGSVQYFRDVDSNGGIPRRNERYAKLTVDWYLFDRQQKDFWLQPIIGIDREVGDDPVTGSFGNNRTTLALKIKVL